MLAHTSRVRISCQRLQQQSFTTATGPHADYHFYSDVKLVTCSNKSNFLKHFPSVTKTVFLLFNQFTQGRLSNVQSLLYKIFCLFTLTIAYKVRKVRALSTSIYYLPITMYNPVQDKPMLGQVWNDPTSVLTKPQDEALCSCTGSSALPCCICSWGWRRNCWWWRSHSPLHPMAGLISQIFYSLQL